ncbi:DUF1735 domain-containing protein [Mucilaginibacter sp. HC2]|uniref:DUF1735 domain-containing protein n=1 Tax=Mucilaginibacter inviolabilis TaxID=2714892 RepID=UPI0014094C52|nr:DUF1735 domain-containing protein [Mucilaginibacter inviolabilis]NHA07730.1 DUF1735 domain-containing protein [Mucilaginibacter inviolabilis]
MKTLKYIKTAFASLAVLSLLSSCLKDNNTTVDFTNAKGSLEIPAVATNGPTQGVAIDKTKTQESFTLTVNLAGAQTSSSATSVTMAIDQAALTAYNTANNKNYVLLPAADYAIQSLNLSIPAGQRQAIMTIVTNSSLIDLTQSYALPISIANGGGQGINPNYKTIIYTFSAK